jgi:DNA-binding CsgD family transcriptional regulator
MRTVIDTGARCRFAPGTEGQCPAVQALQEIVGKDSQVPPSVGCGAKAVKISAGPCLGAKPLNSPPFGLQSNEVAILELLRVGKRYKEIEDAAHLSPAQTRRYIRRIYHKLGGTNRMEAVARWLGEGGGPRAEC